MEQNKIAINHLKTGNQSQQHIELAIKALEKQVPKEILWNNCICTICKEKLQGYEKYCPECGQRLNWN